MNITNAQQQLIKFTEHLTKKTLNQTTYNWLNQLFHDVQKIIDTTNISKTLQICKELVQHLYTQWSSHIPTNLNLISLDKINNEFVDDSDGLLIGRVITKQRTHVHIGSFFIRQKKCDIVCEINDAHISLVDNIFYFEKWRYIPCKKYENRLVPNFVEFSYLEIEGKFCKLLLRENMDILYLPSRKTLINHYQPLSFSNHSSNIKRGELHHLYGNISVVTPFTRQNNQVIFFIIMNDNTIITFLEEQLWLRHLLRNIGSNILLTNIVPGKLGSHQKTFLTTRETKVFPFDDEDFTKIQLRPIDKQTIHYSGVITKVLGDAMFELDNEYILYLTHYSIHNYGRGMRVGSQIRLDNVHPIFNSENQLHGFGCCMYSNIIIEQFSEKNTVYEPIIHQTSRFFNVWQKLSIPEFIEFKKMYLDFQKKFNFDNEIVDVLMKIINCQSLKRNVLTECIDHDIACQVCKIRNINFPNLIFISELINFSQHKKTNFIQRSEDFKGVLLGVLKICEKTGTLQLYDNTGLIDLVLIQDVDIWPDGLEYDWCTRRETHRLFMIQQFILVIENDTCYLQIKCSKMKSLFTIRKSESIFDNYIDVQVSRIDPFTETNNGFRFGMECILFNSETSISIEINSMFSMGLFYLMKIGNIYRIKGVKMKIIKQKTVYIVNDNCKFKIEYSSYLLSFCSLFNWIT